MSGSVLTWSCKQGGSRSQPICLRERWQIKGYSCSLAVKTRNPCSPLTPLCNTHNTHPTGSFLALQKCRGNALSGSSVLENRPLCVGEGVPVADLLSLSLLHLCPVGLLLLAGAVEAQGDPAQPLPGPHAAPAAEHRHH